MIVGIDYTAAAWQGAGIGRYTRELIRTAVAMGGPFRYILFYAAGGLPKQSPYKSELQQMCATFEHVHALPLPFTPRLLTILWQRLRLPLAIEYFTGRLDIVHAPDFVLPPTRARTILTVHDLTFLTHPDCFEPALQTYLARGVPKHLQRADLILADSHATRRDLNRLLDISFEQSVVIYPGIADRFRPRERKHLELERQQLGLPEQFLLFVGTIEPRKNLVRLLEAFSQLRQSGTYPDLHLVIAGRKGWLYEEVFVAVQRFNLASHLHFLDFVDDDMLPTLYNLAEALVYPSRYEGFGLPVAEALACGTPVVTTYVASLPEVAGQAAILVDPYDSQSIEAGIKQALRHQQQLRKVGPQQAQRFTWEQSARALLACYLRVLQAKT